MSDDVRAPTIRYDYIKSNLFRVVHADGLIGGPTPKGLLFMAFWNERAPIPQQVVHDVSEGKHGQVVLGKEDLQQRVSRHSIVRETEIGVLLDLQTAKSMHEWLKRSIDAMEKTDAKETGGNQQ